MNSHHYGDARERGADHTHGDARARGDADLPEVSEQQPVHFWEQLYSGSDAVWSGHVNHTLASVVAEFSPGRSLDLGCGEGGDVMWLAEHGWDATGIDLSQTAVDRAQSSAADRGLSTAHFIAADLSEWAEQPAKIDGAVDPFDLVTASFFQSPVELQRNRILRAAVARVRPGGHLVVISHAIPPGGGTDHPIHFVTPESELEALDLDPETWEVVVSEVRTRSAAGTEFPENHTHDEGDANDHHDHGGHALEDSVIVARKRD